ncbi:cytochrome c3 family protein [Slackia heliotrinireducens]|uniref:cytochrome c3 family protein n=1 Tax=Slackia heliotrinireducens TaxID=84110 RepID=UPI0033151F21
MKTKGMIVAGVLASVVFAASMAGCMGEGSAAQEGSKDVSISWTDLTSQTAVLEDKVELELDEETDCEACHEVAKESASSDLCLAGKCESEGEKLTCVDCHVIDDSLQDAHGSLNARSVVPSWLRRTDISEDLCLSCHDFDEVVANTSEDAYLVDKNGTAVNPHVAKELTSSHSGLTCTSCHSGHEDKPIEETAYAACLGCHHAEVFECGTCH